MMKRHSHHDQRHCFKENANDCVSYKAETRLTQHQGDSKDLSFKGSYKKKRRESDETKVYDSAYLPRQKSEDKSLGHKGATKENNTITKSPEKPNFETSGALLKETNVKNGVILKYTEPADARLPTDKWRLYVFKKDDKEKESRILYLHQCSCFMIGKEPRIAEILLVHPTVSKQHAVIQFKKHKDGSVRPYLLDIESTNGTFLNGERIESLRYYEIKHGDCLRFARSTRDLIVTKESVVQKSKLTYADYVQHELQSRN